MIRVILFIIGLIVIFNFLGIGRFIEDTPILGSIWGIFQTAWNMYLVPLGQFLWTSVLGLFSVGE